MNIEIKKRISQAIKQPLKLSVIIVNFNVKYFLEQCLCSVIKACKNIDAEIIVVDNNSTDGSKEFLLPKFNTVNFIWNKTNAGFAKANNQAVAIAKGDYILFLNPDTILAEDCIEKSIQFFQSHPQAGALGIRMIDGSGKFLKESKRAFPSPLTSLYKLSGLAKLFPHSKTFAKYHLGNLSQNENHEVDVLAGAYMLLPKNILNITSSFDETFFMYGEDVDLSYRIQKAGYKNYYFAQSTIIHFKGESTKKGGLNYVRMFYTAMSLFVKKHYSGSQAGIYNFLIQVAIFLRALVSVIGNLLKKIGLPVLDATTIYFSFWCIKIIWNLYIRKDVNYSPNMLIIAFPVFSIIFLFISFYSGLYDKGYKVNQLNKSTMISALVLLSGYALLPEDLRFSRGILVFGILLAHLLMSIMRWAFIKWKILNVVKVENGYQQTIIVATESDFKTVSAFIQTAGMPQKVLGRVGGDGTVSNKNTLGDISQINRLIKTYPVKEIIFCEGELGFKQIIALIEKLPQDVSNKFHASGSNNIVGSDSKDLCGSYVAQTYFNIQMPVNIRNKNLVDIVVAVALLLSFPVHVFLQKKLDMFFKNIFTVLLRKKTWVGYAIPTQQLPSIKEGVLTSTTLPSKLNDLPSESLNLSDKWYATSYKATIDLKIIFKGYKYLGY